MRKFKKEVKKILIIHEKKKERRNKAMIVLSLKYLSLLKYKYLKQKKKIF